LRFKGGIKINLTSREKNVLKELIELQLEAFQDFDNMDMSVREGKFYLNYLKSIAIKSGLSKQFINDIKEIKGFLEEDE